MPTEQEANPDTGQGGQDAPLGGKPAEVLAAGLKKIHESYSKNSEAIPKEVESLRLQVERACKRKLAPRRGFRLTDLYRIVESKIRADLAAIDSVAVDEEINIRREEKDQLGMLGKVLDGRLRHLLDVLRWITSVHEPFFKIEGVPGSEMARIMRLTYLTDIRPRIEAASQELGGMKERLSTCRRNGLPMPFAEIESLIRRHEAYLLNVHSLYFQEWEEKAMDIEFGGLQGLKSGRGRKKGKQSRETEGLNDAILAAKNELARQNANPSETKAIIQILSQRNAQYLPASWRKKYGVRRWSDLLQSRHSKELLRLAATRFSKVKLVAL